MRRQRFDREAKAISSLNHAHICTLYDVAPNGQRFLILMPQEGSAVPLTMVTNWTASLKK